MQRKSAAARRGQFSKLTEARWAQDGTNFRGSQTTSGRRARRKVRWQIVASTMATTPTMIINSESANSSNTAFDDKHKEKRRNNNGHTFRRPQK